MKEAQSRGDLNLSGVGTAAGGVYQNVVIQGMSKVNGDVECDNFSVEGMATVFGGVKAHNVRMQGKTTVKGDVVGDKVQLDGQITIAGKCDAETFVGSGAFHIDGLLNADEISIQLFGPSNVREIGAQTIQIKTEPGRSLFGRLKKLSADSIEGDDVYLENTKARVVRGNRVVLGSGCDIELVEYRSDFEQHKNAHVGDKKKL